MHGPWILGSSSQQDGVPSQAMAREPLHALFNSGEKTMVYGIYIYTLIYNELVHGGYFMVYRPTYNWGGPSCRYNELGPHPVGEWIHITLTEKYMVPSQ